MTRTGTAKLSRPRPSATDVAHEALKRQILICQLGPGTELREAELAARLGVSRTPVREALNRLVHDGFVEVRPRQGYRVTDVTLAGVHEVFELRLTLEPTIVALAAQRLSTTQADELRNHPIHSTEGTFEDEITHDHDLHVHLAELSGNRYMARSVRTLLAEMQRILFLSLTGNPSTGEAGLELRDPHARLCTAIADRDAQLAHDLVVEEIDQTRRRVLDAILKQMPQVSLQPARVTHSTLNPTQAPAASIH